MTVHNIRPSLYRISYFEYAIGEYKYSKISFEKSQYVYHVLLIDGGSLDVSVGGKTEHVKAGDAVYLLPGEAYRLLPCGEDFSLYNIFFDFLDDRPIDEDKRNGCVFMNCYNASACLPRLNFEDADVLNKSGTIKNVSCYKILKLLLSLDSKDAHYPFYSRAAIFSVITDMLVADGENEKKSTAVQRLLEYIKSNPESDLSGEALSKIFSYHKNHINKLIKQKTGKSLGEYVRHVKIEYAKLLLSEGCYSLTDVFFKLGYYDYSHFYKAFCLETGMTPMEYLKKF